MNSSPFQFIPKIIYPHLKKKINYCTSTELSVLSEPEAKHTGLFEKSNEPLTDRTDPVPNRTHVIHPYQTKLMLSKHTEPNIYELSIPNPYAYYKKRFLLMLQDLSSFIIMIIISISIWPKDLASYIKYQILLKNWESKNYYSERVL